MLFVISNVSYTKMKEVYLAFKDKRTIRIEENIQQKAESEEKEIKQKQNGDRKEETTNNKNQNIWKVEIPKINLVATIQEGTSEQTMNKYVGHFDNTDKWNGNVGLAAHNRRLSC